MQDLEANVGTSAETLVQYMKQLCSDVANYDKFERVFSAPEGTEPQAHLEKYKQDHLSTRLSKDAVDILFDVLSGDNDEALSNHMKLLTEGWHNTIGWQRVDIEGWRELAGELTLQASVDVESNAAPSTDRERVFVKTKSTASGDGRAEKALKDRERERVWAAATTLRGKYVSCRGPSQTRKWTWRTKRRQPPPGVKVSASSRDPKTVHGIQHKTSHPERLREALTEPGISYRKVFQACPETYNMFRVMLGTPCGMRSRSWQRKRTKQDGLQAFRSLIPRACASWSWLTSR